MANKHVPIRVETFNNDDPDTTTATRDIDYNDGTHREWFMKHLFWAMMNNHGLEITPLMGERK